MKSCSSQSQHRTPAQGLHSGSGRLGVAGTEKARLVEDKCEVVGQGLFALLIICLLAVFCVCNGVVAGHNNSVDTYGVACWYGVLPTSVLAISIITELNMKLFCASCNSYSIYPVCATH